MMRRCLLASLPSLLLLVLWTLLLAETYQVNGFVPVITSTTGSINAREQPRTMKDRSSPSKGIFLMMNRQEHACRSAMTANDNNSSNNIRISLTSLAATTNDDNNSPMNDSKSPTTLFGLGIVAFLYWYWLVFGAAAHANGLPGIPDFLPMTPGWPPSQEDLQGPLDDAYHFFYLSEFLGKAADAPYAPPTRLAVYNLAEAWIFAMLPALWKDPNRLSRPVLLGLWAILGINLTNAFLAPYLFVTAAFGQDRLGSSDDDDDNEPERPRDKNKIVSFTMGGIASAVASYAILQTVTTTDLQAWSDFLQECSKDRTYFAFVVDLVLFSIFQPYLLNRIEKGDGRVTDSIPFVGLMVWLFRDDIKGE